MKTIQIHPSSEVSLTSILEDGVVVWANSQIRENAVVGENTSIGIGVYIGPGVQIGNNCKIQNQALIYEPAKLADGVFIGPAVIFTNDKFPRAITPEGKFKGNEDWEAVGVLVEKGASIGAGSTCVAPITIGQWAMVAAGSVVTRDVLNNELVAGIPARHIGWVGKSGAKLQEFGNILQCPLTHEVYQVVGGVLKQIDG